MKIYGYIKDSAQEIPSELTEATLCVNSNELRDLAAFLEKCANEIEKHGPDWEHEHFQGSNDSASLIVFNQVAEQ